MEQKLDFSLPEEKKKSSSAATIAVVLLVVLIAITGADLFLALSHKAPTAQAKVPSLPPARMKELAVKLSQRNLYDRAAHTWQDYLQAAELTDAERAKILFQIGTLLEKAGSYAEAIEYYYRSELTARQADLEHQINTHIRDCFERLGKFSSLHYELIDRTSFKKSGGAGAKIVAEIGPEKISEADLDALIEAEIENQLSPWAAFMTPEQLNEQKKQMLERFKSPKMKLQYLRNWLTEEVLYREALKQQLAQEKQVKKLMEAQARNILSQQMMNRRLAEKIHITETDLRTYYKANKDKYIEPARARISHILVGDKELAEKLIARVKAGEDFAELAKEFSTDETTKDAGGRIDADVVKGSFVPGIGNAAELNARIFDANAPMLLDEPFKTDKGWEIVRVESITAQRQKGFDEVREQVISTLLNEKRQDVQQAYIKQMMEKYDVVIHNSALGVDSQSQAKESPAATKQQ